MKLENIIKRLVKYGFEVHEGQFNFQTCTMCQGTALIDLVDGVVVDTSARYSDVLVQVENNKSHIYTIDVNKRTLSRFNKLGY